MQHGKTTTEAADLTLSMTKTKTILRKAGANFRWFHPLKKPGAAALLRQHLPLPAGWKFSKDPGTVLATYDCTHEVRHPKYRVVVRGAKDRLIVESDAGQTETEPEVWNAMAPGLVANPPETTTTPADHKLELIELRDVHFLLDDCGFALFSGREISRYSGAYPMFPPARRHAVEELDELYFAGDIYMHDNIAHFLLDSLCRAWIGREVFGLDEGVLAFPDYAIPYCTRLRGMLFPRARVLRRHQVYHVKRMLVTTYNLQMGMLHPANIMDAGFLAWLRQVAPRPATPSAKPLVFISRKDATKRPMMNEAEITALAVAAGFVPVVLSDLTLEEQVGLFEGAEIVIGAHGAGMANAVFCRPGATVVELYNKDGTGTDAFQRLATALGLRALPWFGSGLAEGEPGHKQRGWRMDPAEFQTLLTALLAARR